MKFFKKPIFLTIIVALIFGLVAGVFSSLYLSPLMKKEAKSQPDRFLESAGDADETAETKEQYKEIQSIPDIVEKASPAVVSVIVSKYVPILEQYYYNPFEKFEQLFGQDFGFQIPQYREKGQQLQEVGGGTGFIIDSNGLIITNKHVVLDEDAEYTVLTNDGKKYPAPVLARDPIQDIAVLKISATSLPTLKLGDSDKVRIGQTVIVIGNALGEFRNTVSVGVISGLARTITAGGGGFSEQLEEIIQTDAAINEGNSGGPLLNLYGEVIGINTAMVQGAENIGFAIPVNKAKKDISDIETKGKISYPFLGVRAVLINQSIQQQYNLPYDYGASVIHGSTADEKAVMPGSPADKAGIQEDDIILEIDRIRVDQDNTLSKLILKHNVGDKIILKIYRQGEEKIIEATLGEWK